MAPEKQSKFGIDLILAGPTDTECRDRTAVPELSSPDNVGRGEYKVREIQSRLMPHPNQRTHEVVGAHDAVQHYRVQPYGLGFPAHHFFAMQHDMTRVQVPITQHHQQEEFLRWSRHAQDPVYAQFQQQHIQQQMMSLHLHNQHRQHQHHHQQNDPNIEVALDNQELWSQFHKNTTEMVITKNGRRMFPTVKVRLSGLNPKTTYFLKLEMEPVGGSRHKFSNSEWVVAGKAEPQAQPRFYYHPESPATGAEWMKQPVNFLKLKLTNSPLDRNGNIVLSSMHKYRPVLSLVAANNYEEVQYAHHNVYTFPNTEFIAVTAYQNTAITTLKIQHNPFAKGFLQDGNLKRKVKSPSPEPKIKKQKEGYENEGERLKDGEPNRTKHLSECSRCSSCSSGALCCDSGRSSALEENLFLDVQSDDAPSPAQSVQPRSRETSRSSSRCEDSGMESPVRASTPFRRSSSATPPPVVRQQRVSQPVHQMAPSKHHHYYGLPAYGEPSPPSPNYYSARFQSPAPSSFGSASSAFDHFNQVVHRQPIDRRHYQDGGHPMPMLIPAHVPHLHHGMHPHYREMVQYVHPYSMMHGSPYPMANGYQEHYSQFISPGGAVGVGGNPSYLPLEHLSLEEVRLLDRSRIVGIERAPREDSVRVLPLAPIAEQGVPDKDGDS